MNSERRTILTRRAFITSACGFPIAKPLTRLGLRRLKIEVAAEQLYPQYAPDYYAIFFTDPDGIRLEIVNHLARRREIRRVWNKLEEFVNPLQKLRAREIRKTGGRR